MQVTCELRRIEEAVRAEAMSYPSRTTVTERIAMATEMKHLGEAAADGPKGETFVDPDPFLCRSRVPRMVAVRSRDCRKLLSILWILGRSVREAFTGKWRG